MKIEDLNEMIKKLHLQNALQNFLEMTRLTNSYTEDYIKLPSNDYESLIEWAITTDLFFINKLKDDFSFLQETSKFKDGYIQLYKKSLETFRAHPKNFEANLRNNVKKMPGVMFINDIVNLSAYTEEFNSNLKLEINSNILIEQNALNTEKQRRQLSLFNRKSYFYITALILNGIIEKILMNKRTPSTNPTSSSKYKIIYDLVKKGGNVEGIFNKILHTYPINSAVKNISFRLPVINEGSDEIINIDYELINEYKKLLRNSLMRNDIETIKFENTKALKKASLFLVNYDNKSNLIVTNLLTARYAYLSLPLQTVVTIIIKTDGIYIHNNGSDPECKIEEL